MITWKVFLPVVTILAAGILLSSYEVNGLRQKVEMLENRSYSAAQKTGMYQAVIVPCGEKTCTSTIEILK